MCRARILHQLQAGVRFGDGGDNAPRWLSLASDNPESQILPHFCTCIPGKTQARGFLAQPGAGMGFTTAHPALSAPQPKWGVLGESVSPRVTCPGPGPPWPHRRDLGTVSWLLPYTPLCAAIALRAGSLAPPLYSNQEEIPAAAGIR